MISKIRPVSLTSVHVIGVCALIALTGAASVVECQRRTREPGVLARAELEPGKDYITLRMRQLSREGTKKKKRMEELWWAGQEEEEGAEFVALDERADGPNVRLVLAWLEGLARRLDEAEESQLDLRRTGLEIERATRVDASEFDRFAAWWDELSRTVFGGPGESRTGLAREIGDFLADEQHKALAARARQTSASEKQLSAIMTALAMHRSGHVKIERYQMLDKLMGAAERLLATTDKHLARHAKAKATLAEMRRAHHEFDTVNKFLEGELSW